MTSQEWIRFYDQNSKYAEFSNFYVHKKPLVIDNEEYKSVEHYFQAQKYANDKADNLVFKELIRTQTTPGKAKVLANPIKYTRYEWEVKLKKLREGCKLVFDSVEWDAKRDNVMVKALMAKFTQDDHCKNLLLGTGDAVLSEHTPRDKYWGSGGDFK